MSKTAVVVIHGMGSQRPQETIKDFVKNIIGPGKTIYSSPDRISENFETRRLSTDKLRVDFFEYYWANLMQLPSTIEIIKWIFSIFLKKPSERVKTVKNKILLVIAIALISIFSGWYLYLSKEIISASILTLLSVFVLIILTNWILNFFFISIADSIGDVVKYLTPSPTNITARYEIRKNGVNFLKKLHDAKDLNGKAKYNRIVVVAHSLGSVVAYDMIHNLWNDYLYLYSPQNQNINHNYIYDMEKILGTSNFEQIQYENQQEAILKEINNLGNPWKISDFVTVGSPLGHGAFIMAKNEFEFEDKLNLRELPCCPPALENGKFTFPVNYNVNTTNRITSVNVINHSSHFSFTKWNNLYFKNDFIGSNNEVLGTRIRNHECEVKGNWFKKNLWFASHTDYWEKDQDSLEIIKKIIFS